MTDRTKFAAVITLGAVCASAYVLHSIGAPILTRSPQLAVRTDSDTGTVPAADQPTPPPSVDTDAVAPTVTAPAVEQPPAEPPTVRPRQAAVTEQTSAARPLPPKANHRAPQLPNARDALAGVGADPMAEAIWSAAINDPTLPADERKNLIEDLNEDGFADPHNLTNDDVPLILNRLALIEDFAPNAMDAVNAAAFAEAYKDLLNMLSNPNPQ